MFNSANTDDTSAVYDSNSGKVVIAYRDTGNSNHGTAIVGTVSGTSISFGSEAVFNSATTYNPTVTYDTTNQKVVIAYPDSGDSSKGKVIVGTVSGTSISFGTAVVFNVTETSQIGSIYDPTNNKVVIAYKDHGNSDYGTTIEGTVSGTSISFGSEVVFNNGNTEYTSPVYDSTNNKIVIAYTDAGSSNHGTAVVFSATSQTTNLTAVSYTHLTLPTTPYV